MKINKRSVLSVLVTILLIVFMAIGSRNVYAEGESCTIKLSADSTTVKKGQTITVTIKATNINAGTGIIGFAGQLTFTSSDFDVEVTKTTDWATPTLIAKDGSISIQTERTDLTPKTTDQDMVKIALTAKSDTQDGIKKIKLSNIEMTIEKEPNTFKVDDVTASIKVDPADSTNTNNTVLNTNINIMNATNNTKTNTNSNNTVTNMNTNTNTNNLPNSGIGGTQAFIFVPIVMCIFASVVFFIKYKKIYE